MSIHGETITNEEIEINIMNKLQEIEDRERELYEELDGLRKDRSYRLDSLRHIQEQNRSMALKRFIRLTMGKNVCPNCCKELKFSDEEILMSNPPKIKVDCSCGYGGYVVVK